MHLVPLLIVLFLVLVQQMVEDYLVHYPVVHHKIVLRLLGNVAVQRVRSELFGLCGEGNEWFVKKYLLVSRIQTSIWTMQIVGTANILLVSKSLVFVFR